MRLTNTVNFYISFTENYKRMRLITSVYNNILCLFVEICNVVGNNHMDYTFIHEESSQIIAAQQKGQQHSLDLCLSLVV